MAATELPQDREVREAVAAERHPGTTGFRSRIQGSGEEPEIEMSDETRRALEAERDQLAAGMIASGRAQDVEIHGPKPTSAPAAENTPPDADETADETTRLIAAAQLALAQKPRASDPEIARARNVRGLADSMRSLCQLASGELELLAVEIAKAQPVIQFLRDNPVPSLVRRRLIVPSEENYLVRESDVLLTAEKALESLRKALEQVPQIASLKDVGDASYASRLLTGQLQGCIGRSQLVREAAGNFKTFIRSLPERARDAYGEVTTLPGGGVSMLGPVERT